MNASLERNREIAKELAQAWDSVNRAIDSLARKRFGQGREKDVKRRIEDDPYVAARHIDVRIEIGRNWERGGIEGRKRDVASAQEEGERPFANVRDIAASEARHKAREDFEQAASVNPRAANAALDAFIADLESQFANIGSLASEARTAQDYAGASAYEEQAKAVREQLAEFRGMKGQREERAAVAGDFSARAMEAMMRGGGGKAIEQRQLETQQKMADRLGKLVDLYQAPTVVVVD